jgi:glycine cleavage system H protein
MDGFSYSDIFATKGVEYLVVITFLTLLIPFWLILNKRSAIQGKIRRVLGNLSFNILKIPQGLFYSNNHTWMHMEKTGTASVGLDDLLLHMTGEVKFSNVKNSGEWIKRGELLTEIEQGDRHLRILSPVSGKILATNESLSERNSSINDDPYGDGWICKIKPSNWTEEVKSCYFADQATEWSARELERFKDFLAVSAGHLTPETSRVILQDGGELCDHTLSPLSREIWKDFETEFLDLNRH